jgi:glycosyltransferase involved in cell wall biosynthesis
MVERIGDEFDFRIVTSDRDLSDHEPYAGVAVDAWNGVGKAEVYYASPRGRLVWNLARLMRETPHDVVYLNSFFDPVFTQQPLLARNVGAVPIRPMILAPRGEFSPGAIALKAWKKRPYVAVTQLLGVYENLTWQASSEYEAEDIRRAMTRTARRIAIAPQIVIAPDLTVASDCHDHRTRDAAKDGRLRAVFLSRIARKKNLDFALEVLGGVTAQVEMSIYGVIEDDAYWRQCQDMIAALRPNIEVRYLGAVPHEAVGATLAEHDLFLFPTRGENYGHVIHEALAAGLPVLISDQTPWRHLQELGVGWDLPLDTPEAFAAAIDECARLGGRERTAQRIRAIDYADHVASDEGAVACNVELFRQCARRVRGGRQPD